MHRKFVGVLAGLLLLGAAAPAVGAQVSKGYSDVGFVLGIGNIGDANLAFGGRYENIFKRLPDLGNGLLGFHLSADVYTYGNNRANIRVIPIGATMNYHFPIDPANKVDLFLGAGLGFNTVSCSGFGNNGCGRNSNLYVIGRAGGRYFFTPKLALYGDLGAGAATLNLGLTFKLK
ncbi:MAG: hypothetical protein U5K74_00610 [Gemmatimonadaceae bacterium]|nr:hypothetical protein [Gemmatimonadaceae bacterium]